MRNLMCGVALVAVWATSAAAQQTTRFQGMDRDGDGRITREEWRGNARAFARHDWNNDGVLSGDELLTRSRREPDGTFVPEITDWSVAHFRDLDHDDDRRLSREEWHYDIEIFRRIDRDRDGVVSEREFVGPATSDDRPATRAYDTGYAQGLIEGRQAGREDKQLRNQWDLDGQRELEQADSGYRQELGARADYQNGYRRGFRAGYAEGFGRR
jgi:Ca2+-binding EF-hand superfamily protein